MHVALIKRLLADLGYEDGSLLVQNFLAGFNLVGDVVVGPGSVECVVRDFEHPKEHVDQNAERLAAKFVKQLSAPAASADEQSMRQEIFKQTTEDQSQPARIGPFRAPIIGGRRVAPPTRRFGVRQVASSGKTKIRCIDDFAASLVNGLVRVSRRLRLGRISDVLSSAAKLSGRGGRKIRLLKSDFKAAYQCCPILKEHLGYAAILFSDLISGNLVEATQYAMPFGAVAAVYAWDRVGEAIVRIIEHVLVVAIGRYVVVAWRTSKRLRTSCAISSSNL